jgi:hypothetical protein
MGTALTASSFAAKAWKMLLLCSLLLCFSVVHWLVPCHQRKAFTLVSFGTSESSLNQPSKIQWHVKPIKKHHHGEVVFSTEIDDEGNFVYKRTFTVPCGDGILVFSVGPAATYEPYAYELYDDAYVYSNNQGLCVLYPSYKAIQTSDEILWTPEDPKQQTLELGDLPNKITARVTKKPDTKDDTQRGGDFVVMRSGKFYTPVYYKHLKSSINSWPADVHDIEARLAELMDALDQE